MEFGKAFTYVFEDPEWLKKVGIAALVFLIPIIGQLTVIGWSMEITRRVIQNDPKPLPDWSDFGGHIIRGLKTWVIGLVYALPIILVGLCFGVVSAVAGSADDETMAGVVGVLMICFYCVVFLYSLLLMFLVPAAYGRFAATDELGAALKFGEVLSLVRAAPAAYLIVLLGGIVAGFIAGLGTILCFIGIIATLAYAVAINAHFYGQAYNQAMAAKGMQASSM